MRRPNDFAITSKVKSERAKKSPIYASSNTFNQLPEHIKNIKNIFTDFIVKKCILCGNRFFCTLFVYLI